MRTPNADSADFLAKIAPYVEIDGARNLNLISRELGIPYQTLRFRMRHLKREGIEVVAIPDIEKIGLERIRVFFNLDPSIKDPKPLFGALHQVAGLRSYARTLLYHIFDCEFGIPRGAFDEFSNFLHKLEEMRLLHEIEIRKLAWKDVQMLKTKYYDYAKNSWDVDYTRIAGNPSTITPAVNSPVSLDYNDLFIIKELELEPWIKIVELAKKSGLKVEDTAYHVNKHVFGKKLISTFRMRWFGGRDAWLKHTVILPTFIFKQISDEEARHAMSILTSIPFTWSHMRAQDGTYISESILPISQFPESIQYISSQLCSMRLKPEIYFKDWSCASTFTIPYTLYNREKSSWEFKADLALERALHLIKSCST